MPRKPQQERAKATVAAIVDAGLIVLAREGPAATTTRRIAEVAGIGVGSLYEYFDNREAIHQAMVDRLGTDAAAAIRPMIPELVRMSVRDASLAVLRRARQFLEQDEGRYLHCIRYMTSLVRGFPLRALQSVLSELATQYLIRHPEMARARNLPAMTYVFINGGIYTVIRHLSEEVPSISFDELAQALADMVAFCMQGSLAPLDAPAAAGGDVRPR
ncbi:MAG: TetR/AcrR family transcriptional regulator [Nevskia sp.]|nr:TetR/AcrR family transcriptional regulator [Nevskia sp.]